jgi:hypothetical protein
LIGAPQADARLTQLGKIQDSQSKHCPGTPCQLEFVAAGGGKHTFIETVSCWMNVTRNSTFKPAIKRLQLNQSSDLGVHVFLAPISALSATAQEQMSQVFVSGLDYHVPPTSKPQVILELTTASPPTGVVLTCAITGRIDQ